MDPDSIDRIRSATFPLARRGYDKREVDRFLSKLADWLETGGADQARTELVRRELERIGEQTGKLLTDAHDAGEQLRAEAEGEAQRIAEETQLEAEQVRATADDYAGEARAAADAYAVQTRAEADDYGEQARSEADAYSATTREGADAYAAKLREEVGEAAAEVRSRADRDAERMVERARAESRRIVDEANRRRCDVEAVISDLEHRRDAVVAEMRRLSSELEGTATHHGAPQDAGAPEAVAEKPG